MKVSIIIPAYNEEKTIEAVLEKVKAVKLPIEREIIVVNDGSTDNTKKILERRKDIQLIHYTPNIGKGFAIRQGYKKARGDIILIQDADHEYNPKDIPQLLDPVLKEKTNIVYGSRILNKQNKYNYISYYLGNKLISLLFLIVYGEKLTDTITGYKVIRKNVFDTLKLKANGFNAEIEITAQLLKQKEKIVEIPISYQPRTKKEGKKIRLYNGILYATKIFIEKIKRNNKKESIVDRILQKWRTYKVKKHIEKNATICDIGCGNGNLLYNLRNHINEGMGMDKNIQKKKRGNITLQPLKIIKKLPFNKNTFDHVILLAVIEHLDQPEEVINECYRILKPNGSIIVTTPAPKSKPVLEWLAFKVGAIDAKEILDHKKYFSKKDVEMLLKKKKFKEIKTKKFQMGYNIFAKGTK